MARIFGELGDPLPGGYGSVATAIETSPRNGNPSSNGRMAFSSSMADYFFMGLQSLLFYVNVSWLPTLLHDRGLMQFVSFPSTVLMPIISVRRKNQQALVGIICLLFTFGYLGLLLPGTRFAWIWVTPISVAGGASISLALAFFSLRSQHHDQAADLSGIAQSVGYLLAAVGPNSIGLNHHATKTWTPPLLALLVTVLLMLVFGLGVGRDIYVESRFSITSDPKP